MMAHTTEEKESLEQNKSPTWSKALKWFLTHLFEFTSKIKSQTTTKINAERILYEHGQTNERKPKHAQPSNKINTEKKRSSIHKVYYCLFRYLTVITAFRRWKGVTIGKHILFFSPSQSICSSFNLSNMLVLLLLSICEYVIFYCSSKTLYNHVHCTKRSWHRINTYALIALRFR